MDAEITAQDYSLDASLFLILLGPRGIFITHIPIITLQQELKDTLREELDFEHEGHNQERCARDLSHLPYVCVPKIHWDHSSKVRHS